ncbi:hypothetical protein Fot_06237 [Forsythia ovata]|uniref:Uncharacterized protein n=1 Tax=Forsythia ovata TaxID=205694 RepID=A0ABD1WVF4_9LAMI
MALAYPVSVPRQAKSSRTWMDLGRMLKFSHYNELKSPLNFTSIQRNKHIQGRGPSSHLTKGTEFPYLGWVGNDDWFGHATVSQNESQTLASTAKGKLQPRRSQNSATPATFEPAPSEFYFMPTPGIIPANSVVYTIEGPASDLQPAGMENAVTSLLMTEVQTQSFSLDNMVDDLNQIQEDE